MKNHEKVCGSSKEWIELLFDAGTFVEIGAYTKRKHGAEGFEGVVAGYGAVEGKLVFAFAQDNGRAKGAFGERQAKKITNLYDLAIRNGAPVIGIFDSAGTFVKEGAASLSAYGSLYRSISLASGIIPQIAVIDGICGGSLAVAAAMFDFAVTVKDKSKLFVNPPFIVGETANGTDFSEKTGASAYTADNTAGACGFVKSLLAILPQNNSDSSYIENPDDANRKLSETLSIKGAELIETVSDAESFVRLFAAYSENIAAGFATFGGIAACVVASDKSGILDIKTARIISKLVSFGDAFGIPVITFVDSIGLDVSLEAEGSSYASELARLSFAYATSKNAKVTVISGKAYGAVFALLGSKALGADMVFALPDAVISVLPPESSVAFLWNDRIADKSREALETEWISEFATACAAAETGEIDDIIAPAELRQRICASLSMLVMKAKDSPVSRHPTLPL